MTKGQQRKAKEIALSKKLGIKATKEDVIQIRVMAAEV